MTSTWTVRCVGPVRSWVPCTRRCGTQVSPGSGVRTDGVGVHPGYDGSGQPRGYQSTQGVSVVLAPDDQVEAALTAALAVAGDALAVLGLEQALVDPLALAPSARARAVEGARVKATHFADLVGARLGPVRWELEHP
ncbi:MAG: SIMPL domain-containing protein [Austwickia sp.]|nr:SIMPL domain-containing protein [Austwickia sp.]